ncbi:MAG: Holliday junction branch migration protein RuvA [Clostridia bacterium]|nr:Holliday junction branch migration protein RuvA [Clostridia bacterium]
MFSFIKGTIIERNENTVVLENNGVGFEINVSAYTSNALGNIGQSACVYTYLNVREDEMSLFGFSEKMEREVFKKLLLVNGVGPRLALTILSGIHASELTVAVATGRTDLLKGIKGVGTKIRERIILELKEKMDPFAVSDVNVQANIFDSPKTNSIIQQTVNVLTDWGVSVNVAQDVVSKSYEDGDTLETLLAKSFKSLGR